MKKIFSLLAAVLFAGSMMAAEATLQYTGSTTINMVGEGANNAATLGLDADLFTVLADKGSNQNLPGLNKAGDIRLYADRGSGNGNIITVSIASGTITSIVLDIKQTATFVVKAGETAVTEAGGAYAINATSFSIQNTTTGVATQLQLNKITITYTAEGGETPVEPAVLITFGDSAVDKGAWSNGAVIADKDSLVKLTLVDPDAKIAIDLNEANFGTTEEYVTLKSRLKTGGKSSSSKNYINVEVAKDGQLYIMARTGSNSATDRNVVITNGTDTIFNQLLLESNATEVSLDDATSMKIYPVYSASLNAGVTYRISYPVNGVNFYGFDFVPEEEPEGPKNLGKKTIAEFLALKNTTDTCILTGVVSNITNTTYGNFDLYDATDTVYIYGLLTSAGESKKFADLNVAEKDTLTLLAIYNEYNGKPQVKNAIFVEVKKSSAPVVEPVNLGAKTIAEFLALKNTKDTCILTGVVSNITNSVYGNFDLYDATDTVYIYGLLTSAGESKKFADLNVAEKDTLTLLAIYNEYNGKPQVKNAIFVEVKKYVEPVAEHTYTIAGSSEVAFGTAWDPTNAANDMTLAEGIYKWEKKDIALAAGSIKFKVCEDHAWNVAYPAQDYELAIAEAGKYTITITFEPANENKVSATATKTADIVVLPNIVLHGNFSGNWADTDPFVAAQDSLTASLTLALAEGNYEFGFKFDGTWKANGANLTREANSTNLAEGNGNMHITADVPGNYIFTYTYETQGVVVTYPEPIIVLDTVKIVVKEDLEWTDAVASQGWWQIMGKNEGYSFSLSNSFTTEVPGIYTVEDLDYDYSFVKPINGTDTIHFVSGQVVVAINTDSIITFVGALTGNDNKVYAFDLAYDPAAVNPYKYDEKDADFVYDFDSYELNTKYVAQGVMTISAQTDSTSLGLIVYLPQGQTTLVAGEYPVAATPAYQTVVAGYYDAEYAFSGSMAATLIKQGDKLYYNKIWYLVSGKATVDANLNITVDALNSNSKLIKANLKAKAQGIEDVKAAKKATKALKNGILVIEKNGVQYNVTGQEIR